ncbi:uncharacterized protein LOC130955181 [Arachis stenosperma]|uniref:uncharacterized protein LOC130955181 n=1 Tax=Arachis stenosperma TaxID=217475 RepID=UPI0025AC6C99|nr:uncharacterized protein LOC130955181 [Arachis stenosperma]
MAIELDSHQELNHGAGTKVNATSQKAKRTKAPGIRVVGSRIYDSANGITCHQCRQKTRDFAAMCKNLRKGKPCVIKFCHKCLLNRYGEKAEDVMQQEEWICPKCKGSCNCSLCRKKRGEQPTGQMVKVAKASGYNSVSDMLRVNTPETLEVLKLKTNVSPKKNSALKKDAVINGVLVSNVVTNTKAIASDKELVIDISGEPEKENSLDGNKASKLNSLKAQKTSPEKSRKMKREGLKEISNGKTIDDAGKKRSSKRLKVCHEANGGIKGFNDVSAKEIKVNANKGIIHDKKDVKEKKHESKKEMKVDINHSLSCGEKNCPEVRGAHDFFPPSTLASNNVSFNHNQPKAKEDMHAKVLKGAAVTAYDHNAVNSQAEGIAKTPKDGAYPFNKKIEKIQVEVLLPAGDELKDISDVEFQPEDVGNALQFLEFCRSFRKVLDVKKGEAEAILRELVRKQNLRRTQNTLVVQFHIRLLTLILVDSGVNSPPLTTASGNNSWLKALEDLISESKLALEGFPLDCFKEGIGGYHELDLSKKLSLLNFLCDEALCTEKLRSYIDEQNVRFAEEKKEAKSKIAAAKEKEKGLKQKLQDKLANAIVKDGALLSIAEHQAIMSKIKSQAAEAHAEVIEAMGLIPKGKQHSDAMRIEPVFSDGNQTFWKLESYNGDYALLLQDIKMDNETGATSDERWFVYGLEKKDEIDKYITSRKLRG